MLFSVMNAVLPTFQKTIDSSAFAYRPPSAEMVCGRVMVRPSLKVSATFPPGVGGMPGAAGGVLEPL